MPDTRAPGPNLGLAEGTRPTTNFALRPTTKPGPLAAEGAVREAAPHSKERGANTFEGAQSAALSRDAATISGDLDDTDPNNLAEVASSPAPENFQSAVLSRGTATATEVETDFVGRLDSGAAEPGSGRADGPCGRPPSPQGFQSGRSSSYGAVAAPQSAEAAASRAGTPCAVAPAQGQFLGVKEGKPELGTGRSPKPAGEDACATRKRPATDDEIREASRKSAVVETYRELKRQGKTNKQAARLCGHPYMTIYWWDLAYGPNKDFDALLAKNGNSGRKRRLNLTQEEVAAIRANKLLNNRDKNSGSTTLAIVKTIEEGSLRTAIGAELLAREAAGKNIVTEALANELHIPAIFTRSFRNGREEWLRFNSAPGSLMMTRDELTGESRLWQPGEAQTIDDGTKNFVCTVPMERPGDKCWEKYKVVVGRWQILVHVDHRSYMILGINHTARPKGSYRAEDLQSSLHIGFKQHGRPRIVFLEKGISKADLLHHTLDLAAVKYLHVGSPHQKVVEFIFNALWSRLSFLPGQVGRTRGEEAEVSALVESCKRGATDPRDYFLPLATVLQELRKVCEEWNAHLVQSRLYGNWVPQEFFKAEAPKHMRELRPQEEWIFSPTVADNGGEGYLVRAQNVRTSFLVMPGYSWVFDFEAPWLQDYYGARVRLHYNAFEPECPAMLVLQHEFHGERAGTVLGQAEQINWLTRHSRRLFGIEETEDIGLIRTRMNAQAMRRNVIGIRPDGKPGVQAHEARNGAGQGERVTNFPQAPAAPDLSAQRGERDRLSRLAKKAMANISD